NTARRYRNQVWSSVVGHGLTPMDRRREDRRVWQGCGMRLRAIALVMGTLAGWLGHAGAASAVTRTWTGGNASWHVAGNWSPAGVPTASDRAVIGSGTPEITSAD